MNQLRQRDMKRKTIDRYIYEGFGSPVEISKVEMINVRDERHLKIDI